MYVSSSNPGILPGGSFLDVHDRVTGNKMTGNKMPGYPSLGSDKLTWGTRNGDLTKMGQQAGEFTRLLLHSIGSQRE